MSLKLTLWTSLVVYVVGALAVWLTSHKQSAFEPTLWFLVGGGLALVNIFFATWAVRFGFSAFKTRGLFLGLLMMKSFTFVAIVAVILMLLKPLVLPFTLGLGIVIFSSVLAALIELKRWRSSPSAAQSTSRRESSVL